jgi:hypothetical protein
MISLFGATRPAGRTIGARFAEEPLPTPFVAEAATLWTCCRGRWRGSERPRTPCSVGLVAGLDQVARIWTTTVTIVGRVPGAEEADRCVVLIRRPTHARPPPRLAWREGRAPRTAS